MKKKHLSNLWFYELNNADYNALDLHYFHIDDVEDEIESFLNLNYLNNEKVVYFIHGYGAGKLKNKLHDILKNHPLVDYFWLSTEGANAGALTYVLLKNK